MCECISVQYLNWSLRIPKDRKCSYTQSRVATERSNNENEAFGSWIAIPLQISLTYVRCYVSWLIKYWVTIAVVVFRLYIYSIGVSNEFGKMIVVGRSIFFFFFFLLLSSSSLCLCVDHLDHLCIRFFFFFLKHLVY